MQTLGYTFGATLMISMALIGLNFDKHELVSPYLNNNGTNTPSATSTDISNLQINTETKYIIPYYS